MAVTELVPTSMSFDTEQVVTQGAGTAINTSNTIEIPYPKNGKLLLWVDSDHADTAATFTASDFSSGSAALTWSIGNTTAEIIVLDGSKYLQKTGDGSTEYKGVLEITWATNSAGYIKAFYIPNGS